MSKCKMSTTCDSKMVFSMKRSKGTIPKREKSYVWDCSLEFLK